MLRQTGQWLISYSRGGGAIAVLANVRYSFNCLDEEVAAAIKVRGAVNISNCLIN